MIRSAASLIIASPIPTELLKNNKGSNYRILMVKRNANSSFINAHVYPGGIIDKADSEWPHFKSEQSLLMQKICAIRETFEESGLLLADKCPRDIHHWRSRVHQDASQFQVMCDELDLTPSVEKLLPFANWITPVKEKKRYNTNFFLTILDQFKTEKEHEDYFNHVMADGTETLSFDWFKPEEALAKFQQKEIIMMPPQWYSLYLMSLIQDFKELHKAGKNIFRTGDNQLIPILPQPKASNNSEYAGYLAYPGDEEYDNGQKSKRHRLYFKGRPMNEYKLEINISKL
ncbi:hypothetical protein G6F46_003402 [Rhizopus delemar]|uniref:Nudix hydrolase domain-containing protein n=2 Tax=Rhizopus TaxID=4842 RepID=A0A9P6Z8Y1_9FUNG|nr:hypothetical protein G6F55_002301 [Rhizopus delemar]KAG1548606.1 hypothetical protein G6F51_003561 [Rhizopus arrhizus]KAG1495380.1 hypothetical protein G6F54_007215 [Rhizopus delemar]KAG1509628.1 hypothetical protein G6F53_007299 [Rhizopus delemar]KAG1527805.1 hypothetical protein G6F52_001208 [Rhizopus delemar]